MFRDKGTQDFFFKKPMTKSPRKSAFKIRGISTKTKKMKFVRGEKVSENLKNEAVMTKNIDFDQLYK